MSLGISNSARYSLDISLRLVGIRSHQGCHSEIVLSRRSQAIVANTDLLCGKNALSLWWYCVTLRQIQAACSRIQRRHHGKRNENTQPLAGSWFGGLLNTTSVFDLPGVQSVFVIYGIALAALILLGSIVMVNPPDDYLPSNWTPPVTENNDHEGAVEFRARDMLRTPQFYMLWSVFMFAGISGLMVIYCIKLFGVDALEHHGVAGAGAITGTAMAWYAIFNGLGRIAWGSISDRIGRKTTITLMSALQGLVMLMTYHVFISFGLVYGFVVAAALIGFNYGGSFALFPAITADYFGNRNVGSNYGWMFTAYGVAGLAGPLLAGYFKDAAQGGDQPSVWMTPFIIAGVVCLLGAVIMAFTTRPTRIPARDTSASTRTLATETK